MQTADILYQYEDTYKYNESDLENITSKGFLTSDVFWAEARRRLDEKCRKYGLL